MHAVESLNSGERSNDRAAVRPLSLSESTSAITGPRSPRAARRCFPRKLPHQVDGAARVRSVDQRLGADRKSGGWLARADLGAQPCTEQE